MKIDAGFNPDIQRKQIWIYALCEPGTETIRYIGKCHDMRIRVRQHIAESRRLDRTSHRCNWLRSLGGCQPSVVLLEQVSDDNWQERERYWIALHRRTGANLTNTTDGGEGLINPSQAVRKKIGASKIGNKNCVGRIMSEETRRLIGEGNRGKQHTVESKAKMSLSQRGRKHSEETKNKISDAHTGKAKSPESAEASRRARIGIKFSDAHRQRLSIASRGKPKSDKHRAAIAESLRGLVRGRQSEAHRESVAKSLREHYKNKMLDAVYKLPDATTVPAYYVDGDEFVDNSYAFCYEHAVIVAGHTGLNGGFDTWVCVAWAETDRVERCAFGSCDLALRSGGLTSHGIDNALALTEDNPLAANVHPVDLKLAADVMAPNDPRWETWERQACRVLRNARRRLRSQKRLRMAGVGERP